MRRYNNNIFQPVNIFSQFKKKRGNNNDKLLKNTQLLKKFLPDSKQKNDLDKNNKSFKMSHRINNKINNKCNILIENNNNNFSQNIINKTNYTTPINSKLNNNNNHNHNNRILINNMNNNKNKNNYIRNNSNNNNFINNNIINVNSSLNNSSINNNGSIILDKNDYIKEINFQINRVSSN